MSRSRQRLLFIPIVAIALVARCDDGATAPAKTVDPMLAAQGAAIFRFDTFGDESFWTDVLRMNQVILSAVDPTTALSVGLKVDADALPAAVVAGIQDGSISFTSPDTTVALLKLNAVIGLVGTVETVDGKDTLTHVGITCAICHSTVDDSFAKGIGKRLDGWANVDLDPGAIIALSPALPASVKAVYNSWGPGKYDPRYNQDGLNGPQVIPPTYGLLGVNRITSTGDGTDIAYWNRYVSVTQMGGHGSFMEPRTGVSVTNPPDDLVTAKLPALQEYQLSLAVPAPPPGSFKAVAAQRGAQVFVGAGQCEVPQRHRVHRREPPLARSRRGGERARAVRRAQLRLAKRHEAIPDGAAPWGLAARAVLPQRPPRRWRQWSTATTRRRRWD